MFDVFKAGNPLGVHKCCIDWAAKENGNNPPKTPQDKLKETLPRFSCSIYISVCAFVQPHVGEFCFFPVLKSGYSGHQGLCAKTDEMCS